MIEIRNLQGDTLDLSPDQRLTIEQASTLMADDELVGGFSYPIRFPLTARNDKFLAYGYRPDAYKPNMELAVQVKLEGHLYRKCTLSYRVQDSQGDGFLKIDSGELADEWKKKTLQEAIPDVIDLGIQHGTYLAAKMLEYATADPGLFPFTFFPIKNAKFIEMEFAPANYHPPFYMNDFGGPFSTFLVDDIFNVGRQVVPQFYLAWVLGKLLDGFGYRLTGDWIASEETQRLTLLGNTAIISAARFSTPYQVKAGLHLPELSVSDFIKAIKQRYGLSMVFNANLKTCSIRTYRDISRQGKPVDLSGFQLAGYGIDAGEQKGFKVLDFVDDKDDLFRDAITNEVIPPAPYLIGKAGTEIQLKVGAPKMIPEGNTMGGLWRIPAVHMEGNLTDLFYKDSDRFVAGDKRKYPPALRLLSYRGMSPDNNGTLYPFATSDGLDAIQQPIGIPTALEGNMGLWRHSLRRYYQFRNDTRKVTTTLLLPVSTLNQLNPDEPISLKLNDQIATRFLISKLQIDAPGQGGKVRVKFELQTMPSGPEDLAEMGYETPVNRVVWVSMDIVYGPVQTFGEGVYTTTQQQATVTIFFWKDASLTVPATVENLTVNIVNEGWDQLGGSNSTTSPYVCSGSSTVILTDVVVFYKRERNGNVEDHFTNSYGFDFGTGYNV